MLRGGWNEFKIVAYIPPSTEGEIRRWHRRDGDHIRMTGTLLCTIEFEALGIISGITEISAPAIGTLHIEVKEGRRVRPEQLIGTIERGTIV